MSTFPVSENDTVAGKYRIGRMLGAGGMGVVFAAEHLELDRTVAIKFLLPEFAEHAASAERFRREARAAAKIRSEHVCRVIDVGTLDGGTAPYLVMEYLEGRDLGKELTERGRLPPIEAVDYLLQACEAVAEAHRAGIVHRDLKPENLFLAVRADGSRTVKVLDFGVSKSVIEGQLKLTKTASLVGSPLYMSPEQLDATKSVDPRADVWALGIILYELVAGRTPFVAETVPQLVHSVMHGTPRTLEAAGVMAPPGFEAILLKALEKNRDARIGSVPELAQALAPFAPAHSALSISRTARMSGGKVSTDPGLGGAVSGIAATTPSADRPDAALAGMATLDVVGLRPPAPKGVTPATWGHTGSGDKKSPKWPVVIGFAALAGLAVVAWIALAPGGTPAAEGRPGSGTVTPSKAAAAAPQPIEPPVAPAPAPVVTASAEAPAAAAPSSEPAEPTSTSKASTSKASTSKASTSKAPRPKASAAAAVPPAASDRSPEGISDFGGRR